MSAPCGQRRFQACDLAERRGAVGIGKRHDRGTRALTTPVRTA